MKYLLVAVFWFMTSWRMSKIHKFLMSKHVICV